MIENLKVNLGLVLLFLAATSLASVAYVVLGKAGAPELFFSGPILSSKVCSVLGCIAQS